MDTAEIKRRFLSHFERNGHTVVPSAPLPFDDPNLLFVNAGMVQFVPYFIGQQAAPWTRATSVQKCIRTQDIEEVGKTTRHGTFFQMNGNFSFGDYFKSDAIRLAWELSTNSVEDGGFGLDGERIWATVYLDDEEAIDIWHREIGLPMERIVRRGMDDNFWSMGIPGPCGPCSELYYDRGPDYGREGGPAVDEDRYMEFWNLVFMQDERGPSFGPAKSDFEVLGELPAKNIDTGMGLERMAVLLQGVDNLYEIDQTVSILLRAAELTGKTYGAHSGHAASQTSPDDVRLRVIADHTRTALMLIGDGVTPSNEGRGYVLRRILRRVIYSMRALGYDGAALPELMPVARDCMAPAYPELATGFERIAMIAYAEEETFRRTLAAGTTILDSVVEQAKQHASLTEDGSVPVEDSPETGSGTGAGTISGAAAFQLHDTYGFPIDLTLEMAAEQGLTVDEDGFRRLMSEQRQRAKADSRANKTGHANNAAYRELRARGATEFLAYTNLTTDSTVLGILRDGDAVSAAAAGATVEVVLNRTPFYAESGGQIADEGVIRGADGTLLRVLDVQRPLRGLIAHRVTVEQGEVTVGQPVSAEVDAEWRISARQAHSGTHIVHAALRQVLGPSALQSGSYNRPGYLRLDFAWGSGLDARTRTDIEEVANQALRHDLPVEVRYMPLDQAREIGALALFGETYDEQVRVVDIGGAWSRELCGGTHVAHASQVGVISVLGESSVGAGVRRLEAYVGIEAVRFLAKERALVSGLSEQLKARPEELSDRVAALVARLRTADKELEQMRVGQVLASAGQLAEAAELVDGVRVATVSAPAGVSGGDLRSLALAVRSRLPDAEPAVVVAVSDVDGTAHFVVAVNSSGQGAGINAGDLVKTVASVLGARGGGKADLAQGAGGDAGKAGEAFDAARAAIRALVARS